jgi:sodium transport system permease protein
MKWSNVKLILQREIRDQLRDRRTLFMIAVLPLLLYPLLGMSFFQMTQFLREHPVRVLVAGYPEGAALPPLVESDRFAASLFVDARKNTPDPKAQALLHVVRQPAGEAYSPNELERLRQVRRDMAVGNFDEIVFFPAGFSARYEQLYQSLAPPGGRQTGPRPPTTQVPDVEVYPNLAKEASRAGHRRVLDVLEHWRDQVARQNLEESQVPVAAARPFAIVPRDVAEAGQHQAILWSKILPFVLIIWALTGAFYPAVDLCAGEKERGTLETLLSSPAERLEIVWGKLLTIMLFSSATAVLNLASMGITGSFVLSQLPNLGPPPGVAVVWLLVALLPISALFSALCLALAAFARSTKEGQYYLMPLVLVIMPLVLLPMAPGVELTLGNSLIPVTGVVLLLRSMLEGNYLAALPYMPPVAVVTLGCCWLAIRWATNQFNSESVLFRESERWDLHSWVRHLLRDREATPSLSEAVFCGVLILLIRFFMSLAIAAPQSFRDLALSAAVTALVVVATPAVLMAVMLTRSPAQTLLLKRPPLAAAPLAVLLALVLHPAVIMLQDVVRRVYPISQELVESLNGLLAQPASPWVLLLSFALAPAVCEELAFRGFILSGLRRSGSKWTAIVVSSIFFGAAHAIFQQSLVAFLLGLVIGYLAVQSGSLWPGVLFHVVHNSLALMAQRVAPWLVERFAWLDTLIRPDDASGQLYHWGLIVGSVALSIPIFLWFHRLPYEPTAEESLRKAVDRPSGQLQPG